MKTFWFFPRLFFKLIHFIVLKMTGIFFLKAQSSMALFYHPALGMLHFSKTEQVHDDNVIS